MELIEIRADGDLTPRNFIMGTGKGQTIRIARWHEFDGETGELLDDIKTKYGDLNEGCVFQTKPATDFSEAVNQFATKEAVAQLPKIEPKTDSTAYITDQQAIFGILEEANAELTDQQVLEEQASKLLTILKQKSYAIGRFGREKAQGLQTKIKSAWDNTHKTETKVTPLSEIQISEEFYSEDDKYIVKVTRSAESIIKETDQRMDGMKKLIACLKAS